VALATRLARLTSRAAAQPCLQPAPERYTQSPFIYRVEHVAGCAVPIPISDRGLAHVLGSKGAAKPLTQPTEVQPGR
jgi:hypothetical protein